MNEIYVLIYALIYKLSYLNLQFNYIPDFRRANFIIFNAKKVDTNAFLKWRKLSLWNARM